MGSMKGLKAAGIVAAATMGTGFFALPYVIQASGWLLALCYFVALTAAVSLAHIIYLRTLVAVDEKERLLGLVEKYFGRVGFWIGFLAIVVGLLLGFVAYLILGAKFLAILFPGIPAALALGIFWFLLACLAWRSGGRVAGLEIAGVALMVAAISFIFFSGRPDLAFANMPSVVPGNFFLPFGAVLFSLAGWTSVEQVYELYRSKEKNGNGTYNGLAVFGIFIAGTALAGLLYWLFALGVIGSVPHVATDTISGIGNWPAWRRDVLAVIGLVAVCMVSLPLSREIRGAMERDLKWNSLVSRGIIIGLPLVAVLSGFTNFLVIISLVGGVFLSTQYLLIISVGRRVLVLTFREKFLLDALAAIFLVAAVYEVVTFVVH